MVNISTFNLKKKYCEYENNLKLLKLFLYLYSQIAIIHAIISLFILWVHIWGNWAVMGVRKYFVHT